MEKGQYKLILTSRGLNQSLGTKIIKQALELEGLKASSIFAGILSDYEKDKEVMAACKLLGFSEENIYLASRYEGKSMKEFPNVDYVYVTEGNTFEVMDWMRKNSFDVYVKKMVKQGAVFIGASAGAILASSYFEMVKYIDSNYLRMTDFTGLGLMPDTDIIRPHYTKEQLQLFIEDFLGDDVHQYSHIYACANNEALIMDCRMDGDKVVLHQKKRIHIE